MARFSTEVWAASNLKPASFSNTPAALASLCPFSLKAASAGAGEEVLGSCGNCAPSTRFHTPCHPQNLLALFHSLSPCLMSTSLWAAAEEDASAMVDEGVVGCWVVVCGPGRASLGGEAKVHC